MNGGNWILGENHVAIQEPNLYKWAAWMEASHYSRARIVRQTKLKGIMVSTVFLGVDHSWGAGKPMLFETMAFQVHADGSWSGGGDIAFEGSKPMVFGMMRRYSTWHEALAGHQQAVDGFKKRLEPAGSGNVRASRRRMSRLQEVFNGRVHPTKPA